MTDKLLDAVIIGQGLAGTSLAWTLKMAGKTVCILDEGGPVSCSKIAAGLITPITGKRLVLSRDYKNFFSTAQDFYQNLENIMGARFFKTRTARRFLQTDEEMEYGVRRKSDPEYMPFIISPVQENGRSFDMRAAQLDVAEYLSQSRDHLDVQTTTINWNEDVSIEEDHVSIGPHKARYVISCEGYQVTRNPYFSWVKFNPAKGEILTVRFSDNVPDLTYHQNLWMAPTGDKNCFYVGSTYDWNNLDMEPTAEGRQDIERRLRSFIDVKYEVLEHKAAIRPIIFQSLALIGTHPQHPRIGFFNGLGSKGSLQAPRYAQDFVRHLFSGERLREDCDLTTLWPDRVS